MTNQDQETTFVPRDYDIFGGLDVDKKSIAVTFKDHGIMRKSLRLPYSAAAKRTVVPGAAAALGWS